MSNNHKKSNKNNKCIKGNCNLHVIKHNKHCDESSSCSSDEHSHSEHSHNEHSCNTNCSCSSDSHKSHSSHSSSSSSSHESSSSSDKSPKCQKNKRTKPIKHVVVPCKKDKITIIKHVNPIKPRNCGVKKHHKKDNCSDSSSH